MLKLLDLHDIFPFLYNFADFYTLVIYIQCVTKKIGKINFNVVEQLLNENQCKIVHLKH